MGDIIATFDNYIVYKYLKEEVGTYYLCVPTGNVTEYNMFVGFPNRELSELSNNEISLEISKVADSITSSYEGGVYVLPGIPYEELVEAAKENDDRMYSNLFWNKVTPITTEVYTMLDGKFNTRRNMIKRDDGDRKFIDWIVVESAKYGEDLIGEIEYSNLVRENELKETVSNTILDIPTTSSDQGSGGIAPVNHEFDESPNMKDKHVMRKVKFKNTSSGFSSIKFIVATLIISIVIGIWIGYLLIK